MKYTTQRKKELLVRLIELMLYTGYDISDLVGRPLSYFNYTAIEFEVIPYYENIYNSM